MTELYVPNSIALRNFDTIFSRNSFDFSDGLAQFMFHPRYVAMHPVGLAFYAALRDYFTMNGIEVTAMINRDIRSIPYLQRMGLFTALGFQDPVTTAQHEEAGRFIPLTRITSSKELSAFLILLDPILHADRNTARIVKHVFSELLRNVVEHAESPVGGHVCATYNHRRRKISVGIADAGRGIRSAMRGHKIYDSNQDAILAALVPGVSGTTRRLGGTRENAGAGLFFTKCIAQSTRNHFLIYSGDSYFKLLATPRNKDIVFQPDPGADRATIKSGLPNFNGTLVGIDVSINDSDAFNELIDRIGATYSASLKKATSDHYKRIKFS